MPDRSRPDRRSLLALGALLALGCAAAPTPDGPPLRVACDFTNPPFASLGPAGEPVGRDVRLAEELARGLGRPLVFVRAPFDALLARLEAGEADLAIATIGRTPERAARVAFSSPYLDTAIVALVRRGPGEPERLGDLAGRRVSAGAGTTSLAALEARGLAGGRVGTTEKDAPVAERLLDGELDAAVMDAPDAFDLARLYPELRVLPEPLAAEAYCVAVRPDAPELLRAVDAQLDRLRRSGWLAHLGGDPVQRTQRFLVR